LQLSQLGCSSYTFPLIMGKDTAHEVSCFFDFNIIIIFIIHHTSYIIHHHHHHHHHQYPYYVSSLCETLTFIYTHFIHALHSFILGVK
jgi:hypothetical protein